jgi:flagellar motor switch protein FliN/FliY
MVTNTNAGDEGAVPVSDEWAEVLKEQAEAEQASGLRAKNAAPVFSEFSASTNATNTPNDIDFILDIPVQLTVELGRTKIAIKDLLQLVQGSVVELNGMAGAPMDVLINGTIVAQGEVVVVNEKFGVRVTDIITPTERILKLKR